MTTFNVERIGDAADRWGVYRDGKLLTEFEHRKDAENYANHLGGESYYLRSPFSR